MDLEVLPKYQQCASLEILGVQGSLSAPKTGGASAALLVPKMLCMDGKLEVLLVGRVLKLNEDPDSKMLVRG